jgi:hypothetical protein
MTPSRVAQPLRKSGHQHLTEREIRAMSPSMRLVHAERVSLPYSEVCCHMQVAGKVRPVLPCGHGMAWILNNDGSTFSFPVTRGEAGVR